MSAVHLPCCEPPPPELREGIAQFNRGEFFEQHETLEDLWREEGRPFRRLYQGILQIGVALYHVQRCNHHGARTMLIKGSAHLQPFTPTCQGIDVVNLLASTSRILEAVDELGPNHLDQFDWSLVPRIRWVNNQQS